MIIKIVYPSKTSNTTEVVSQLGHCTKVLVHEKKDKWGFTAYKNNEMVADFMYLVTDKIVAYVMEGGQTVDKLPRR